jgi:DNA-binding NarL/FixJ family response regulator
MSGVVGSNGSVHVLLVDADVHFAEAVCREFCCCGVAVAVAPTLAQARDILSQASPLDVVLLEIRLPDGRGESLLLDIEARPRQPVAVIVSAFLQDLSPQAFEYRPVVVEKSRDTQSLLKIVRTVTGGYAGPSIKRFVTRFKLTQRETETITLIAHGRKPKEIAALMCCSEQAVYAHLVRACRKTHCLDYHQLVSKLFEFSCQALGHTSPESPVFINARMPSQR